jgi:hypothetical protein
MWGNYRGRKRAEDMRPPEHRPSGSWAWPAGMYVDPAQVPTELMEPATEAGQPPDQRCCCPCHATEG